ncbi:MBL fold metallo-hydrolase [Actinomadura fibrosa]|uniref:MBL fold metallo-hydrolase n=1 Tax=Actinomadura fibrosa TaxID=111802 RepID=A0ABW2Y612_9ACTN|nr:MBL fold metallo-hydrolase [Actinomadura fibrosa]
MSAAPPPSLDLGGIAVTWLADIPSMDFAPDDLLVPEGDDRGPGADLDLTFGGYLITTGTGTVLVDTGVGDGKARSRPGWNRRSDGALPAALERTGRALADVGTVFLTHLHADHVGWNTSWGGDAWVPTFPEATYLALADELDWGRGEYARDHGFMYGSYADSVVPLIERGRLEAAEDGSRLGDRIEVRAVPGHTPGSAAVIVRGSRETAVLSGDLIHHPHQFAHPMTCSRFCVDRAASAKARHTLLDWTARHGAVLMPAHFGWGRVEAANGRFRFQPLPR